VIHVDGRQAVESAGGLVLELQQHVVGNGHLGLAEDVTAVGDGRIDAGVGRVAVVTRAPRA